ncbi:MAG: hypothetical protein IT290_10265 [Deltaproteobacteria bacterium]|nr:hypothetical protein [Deltaproteobacteria bacterium]
MIDRFCETIPRQIALFVACIFLSMAILALSGFVPSVRLSGEAFGRGLGAGVLLTILAALLLPVVEAFGSPRGTAAASRPSPEVMLGRAVVLAFGEELVLRGFIFAPIALFSFWLALALNFALAFLLGMSRNDGMRGLIAVPMARALEGTFCAVLYSWNRALFVVVVARAIREILIPTCCARPEVAVALERLSRRFRGWVPVGFPRRVKRSRP